MTEAPPVEPQKSSDEHRSEQTPALEPPPEPGERVLLLTSGGPLVVEISLTVDGQPLRMARQRLVDELLGMGDSDGDGNATWAEAIAHRRFAVLEAAYRSPENDRERDRQRRRYDRDSDGQLSRAEAEDFIGRVAGSGNSLTMESDSYQAASSDNSRLRDLLDADGDNSLSNEEWRAAPGRLKLYDVDDNDLISLPELSGTLPTETMNMGRPRGGDDLGLPRAMLLGVHANWSAVMYALEDLYLYDGQLRRESFPLSPTLFDHLDLDGDGKLTRAEAQRLNSAKPHLRIEANFGRAGDRSRQPAFREISAELAEAMHDIDDSKPGVLWLAGIRLQLALADTTPGQDFEMMARRALAQLDKDNNAYIDQEEFEAAADQRPEAKFEDFDQDDDEKIVAQELMDYFARQQQEQSPAAARIHLVVRDLDDPFFWALDASGDGRLSPRELAAALATIKSLDASGDGQLTREEIPAMVSFSLERGERNNNAPAQRPAPQTAAEQRGPRWFAAMDRNGDQDISATEFLGTPEQFAHLDHNRDGFVDVDEALSASAGP